MKKCLVFFVAAFLWASGYAQIPMTSYVLAAIPESVKKDADVVKRYENVFFEVTDIDRAELKSHTVYTIFSDKGSHILNFRVQANKFRMLGEVDIRVYDAFGKAVQKFKRKDLLSYADGDGLIDDGKVFYMRIPVTYYPVTVEINYELRYKGTLFYPSYDILSPGVGVEMSVFTAKVPKGLDLRFKPSNVDIKPEITEEEKYKSYRWTVKNLSPVKYEEDVIGESDGYPSVVLAPNKFKMDDYEGDMSTWRNFGMWYANLKKGIDVLPENKKSFFRNLVQNAKDDREKVKLVYEYLQKNFRYVSIQLGIGGYRPLAATFTDDKKYGDCKGLSNYVQAALEAVNVKSYQALIYRDANPRLLTNDFPLNEFNHVILLVPDKKDTIWLECTSKTLDFDKLDISTENRHALVVTEEGGVLVRTPDSRPEENLFSVRTTVELQEGGEAKTSTLFTTTGYYKEEMNEVLMAKKDEQKQILVRYWQIKQPDNFELAKKEQGTALDMEIEKVPEFIAGNKMFLAPRFIKLWRSKLPAVENRKQDYFLGLTFDKRDTTIFKMPAGFTVDALPKGKELNCPYASYTTKYWFNEEEKAIYSSTQLLIKQYRVPAAAYNEVKKFFDEVLLDDAQRIVIKKS